MLRPFRAADAPQLYELLQQHFPEEGALMGYHRDVFIGITRRLFRWDFRLLVRMAALFRRPIVKFFTLQVDGQIAATTLLSFPPAAGYVAMVMVDTPYRRRGYAKELVRAAERTTRESGRGWVALDVLRSNTAARALYDSLGYRLLRAQAFYALDLSSRPTPEGLEPALPPGIRPIARSDGKPIVELARAQMPEEVAKVLPPSPSMFLGTPPVTMQLRSETAAWVIDRGHGVEGFVRATVTPLTDAAHLTAPVVGPAVAPELGRQFVEVASEWAARRKAARLILEAPDHNVRGLEALRAAGYRPAFPIDTLYHALDA